MEKGHLTEVELYDLIDGTLPKSEEKELRLHMKKCSECMKLYNHEVFVHNQLERSIVEQPSADFTENLIEKLAIEMAWQEAPVGKLKKSTSGIFRWGILTFSVMGILLILLIFSSLGSFSTSIINPAKLINALEPLVDNSFLIHSSLVLYGLLALMLIDRFVLRKYFRPTSETSF